MASSSSFTNRSSSSSQLSEVSDQTDLTLTSWSDVTDTSLSSLSFVSSSSSYSTTSPSSVSSYGTRSSSSLTDQFQPSQSSLSPSSDSILYSTSSASSSSQSQAESGSQLVLFRVARNENFASYTVVVDLSELDARAVEFCGKPRIDPGGTHAGYQVRHQSLPIHDGMRMFLKIEPREDIEQENLIYQAWQQHVLSQLRAGVAFAREEAAILGIQTPKNYRAL